jgi:hypothetical protein
MTPKATINSGLAGGGRSDSLDVHAPRLYERPAPVMAVIELMPVDRVTPVDADSKKDPLVRLMIRSLEVAPGGGAESTLRDVHRALFKVRTANGTLGSEDEVAQAEQTLEHAGAVLAEHEAVRLRVVLDVLIDRVSGVLSHPKHRETDVRRLIGELLEQAEKSRDTGVQLDLNGAGG